MGLAAASYGQPAPPAPAVAPADVEEPLIPRAQIDGMKRDIEEAADRIRTITIPPVPAMKFDFDFDFDFKEDISDRARLAMEEARYRADLEGVKAMMYAQLGNPKPMPMPTPKPATSLPKTRIGTLGAKACTSAPIMKRAAAANNVRFRPKRSAA